MFSLVLALALFSPREAKAERLGVAGAAPGIAIGLVTIGAIVAPIGAMVNVAQGTPSQGWGHASFIFGGIATGAGTVPLVLGIVEENDRELWLPLGSVAVSLGLGGLLWGGITEALLPEEDPGIPGMPRPPGGTSSTFSIRAQF